MICNFSTSELRVIIYGVKETVLISLKVIRLEVLMVTVVKGSMYINKVMGIKSDKDIFYTLACKQSNGYKIR